MWNYVTIQQGAWIRWIYLCVYCYNTTYNMTIQITPFMALYNYEVTNFLDLLLGDSWVLCVGDLLQKSKDIIATLRDNIGRAQKHQN